MTDGEKNDSDKKKNNLKEKDCPLSPTDWIMFLSAEIRHEEMKLFTHATICIVIISLCVSGVIAVLYKDPILFIGVFFIFLTLMVAVGWSFLHFVSPQTQKRVQALKKLRGGIIFGENDSNKIREEWKNI